MRKISAVIPDDVVAVLKERAQAQDRSLGSVIRRALADHIARPATTASPPLATDGKDSDGG